MRPVILAMLCWEEADRITVRTALKLKLWQPFADPVEEEEDQDGRAHKRIKT